MKRVELQWPDDLVAAIDAARGDVPRTKWLQRVAESALVPAEEKRAEALAEVDALMATMPRPDQTYGGSNPVKPKTRAAALAVPGVKTARELMGERQAKLNKAKS